MKPHLGYGERMERAGQKLAVFFPYSTILSGYLSKKAERSPARQKTKLVRATFCAP